ncbi:LtrC (plasmid) [Lactiplantibacillus plantarum]|nr:LtrC [Lactiplantibacillus plantarum]ARO05332.1 LtrC [Lactiplantibacillus plantarum]
MPTKEEAEEWKKQLVDNAEQQILNLTDSEKFKSYLDTVAKFHRYSQRNIDLIYSQNPSASQVAGFKKWQNDFKRSVNKGEKGIRIAAPIIKKLTPEDQKRLDTTKEKAIVGYRYIPVFDISQTSGEPVLSAKDFVKENLADHQNVTSLYNAFKDYLNQQTDLKISEVPLATLNGAKGYFQPSTNEIVIGGDEPDNALKLKTLYHEYAHSQLHGLKSAFKDRPRAYQETQAEAVAYVAMQNIGVDTSNYSLGYVATWAKDKAVIHSALSEIQQVSNKVIELSDGLTKQLGLQQEKANKITEKIEDIAKEKLVVKADNPVEAVKKLYNNNLQNAIQESYTLSDISEKEADYFRKTATWEDVADIEKSNNAIKDLGHGYYADEYIERNDNNPHSANQSILKNNDPEQPTLSQQYKNLLKQVQDPAKNNQQAEKQLKQVHQEISNRTQNQLKDFAKHNPEVKQPEKEETQQIRR